MSTIVTQIAKLRGIRYEDAKDSIVVTVMPEDVRGAKRGDPCNCAFARAVKRQTQAEEVFIFRTTGAIRFAAHKNVPGRILRYVLPWDARGQIEAFDAPRGPFKPARFVFEAPSRSQTLEAVYARSAKRPGRHYPGNGTINRSVVRRTSAERINTLRFRIERIERKSEVRA